MALRAAGDDFAGDMVLMPGTMIQPLDAPPNVSPKLGVNLPGHQLRAGDGWWLLLCDRECVLRPASLSVSPARHGQYDGDPLPSQELIWSPLPPHRAPGDTTADANLPALMLAFKPLRDLGKLELHAGPVKTWLHAGMAEYPRPPGEGTMETLIQMDGNQTAVLRPVTGLDSSSVYFQLNQGGVVQRIGQSYQFEMDAVHPLKGPNYLLWAGDLDGDGRLDLLMSFAERGVDVKLYLSSLAKRQDDEDPDAVQKTLVEEAGSFTYWDPSDSGC